MMYQVTLERGGRIAVFEARDFEEAVQVVQTYGTGADSVQIKRKDVIA